MDRLALLQSLTLFAGVPPGELARLAEIAEWRSIPVGMVLMDEGEEGDSLFIVVQGRFVVDVGSATVRQRVDEVGPGEILGETVLFRRSVVRSARVAAAEPSIVIRLGILELEALSGDGNRLPLAIERAVLHTLTERIAKSRDLIEEVLFEPIPPPSHKGLFQRLRSLMGLGA